MIAEQIRQRLVRGIGANLYGQLVVVIVQLGGVPILLHAWGIQLYGEWLILWAIPSYMGMTDLGFSMSAGNDMTTKVARQALPAALAVFQSISLLISISASIVFVAAVIIFALLPFGSWMHLSSLSVLDVRLILIALSADVLVKLFDGINHAGFRANGEYALHTTITNTTPLLQQIVVWSLALTGHGLLSAAVGIFLVRIVVVPSTYWLLLKRHSWLKSGFRHAERSELRRLFGPAMGNLAIPMSQALSIQGMVLVIASVLGPISVVMFSTLRTLTRLTLQLVATISNAAEPEFAGLDLATTKDPLISLYSQTIRISLWIAGLAVIGLALFGGEILRIWTHGRVLMNTGLFFWLLATVISQALWFGALSMLKSRNQHMKAAVMQLATSILALLLAFCLLHITHDIIYAGLALFVSDAAFMMYTMSNVQRLLGVPVLSSLVSALDPRPLAALISRSRHA